MRVFTHISLKNGVFLKEQGHTSKGFGPKSKGLKAVTQRGQQRIDIIENLRVYPLDKKTVATFFIDEAKQIVSISNIFYGSRDYETIMPVSGGKDFVQGYNCQAVVDKKAQVIVGTHVTHATNDKQQVLPLVADIVGNNNWDLPKIISADSGCFSEANCKKLAALEVDAYIATAGRNMVKQYLLLADA